MKNIICIILSFLLGCLLIIIINPLKKEVVTKEFTENNIQESIKKVYNTSLTILGYTNSDNISTIGSSFVYKIDDTYAYILTNYHVVKGLNKIEVMSNDEVIKQAILLGYDEYKDIAVLKVEKFDSLKQANFSDSSKIDLGDTVFTIGTPLTEDYYGTVTTGVISYKNRLILNDKNVLIEAIQTNTTINKGNSGSALFNANGEVIGIVTSKIIDSEIEGISFAIPINDIKTELDKLESGIEISRINMDMKTIDMNNNYELYKNELYLSQDYKYGIYIKEIGINSILNQFLKEKDILLKINGINIKNYNHFEYLINKYDNINIELERNKELITINFTL